MQPSSLSGWWIYGLSYFWLEADREKLVKGSEDRCSWFVDLLNNEFGNGFDLSANSANFRLIIPSACF
jgi:hypothetical protein